VTVRIEELVVEQTRITSAEAVLTVTARLSGPAAGLELRGRLTGPYHNDRHTIAVAYPLQPARSEESTASARIVVPEPNVWTPAAPFRYDGIAELLAAGAVVDRRTFVVHLKAK
jgi:hypothetical protein